MDREDLVVLATPAVISIARLIHFRRTLYILPDEALYYYAIRTYWDGSLKFYPTRIIFQLLLLALCIPFRLNTAEKFFTVVIPMSGLISSLNIYLLYRLSLYNSRRLILPAILTSLSLISVSSTVLTEIIGLTFILLSLLFFMGMSWRKTLLSGFFAGLALNMREPYALVFVLLWLYLLVKDRGRLLPFTITGGSLLIFSMWNLIIVKIFPVGQIPLPKIHKVSILPANSTAMAPPLTAILTTTEVFLLLIIFTLGVGVFFIPYSIRRSKLRGVLLLGVALTLFIALKCGLTRGYAVNTLRKASTFIRFGYSSLFMFPALSSPLKRREQLVLTLAILLLAVPLSPLILRLVQSNLSVGWVNRLSLNYESPWLRLRKYVDGRNVLIVGSPIDRLRLFLPNHDVIYPPENLSTLEELSLNYSEVYFYGMVHAYHYQNLQHYWPWYYELIKSGNLTVVWDDGESYLYRWKP